MKAVCSEYRIHNADIHLKEDCDVDDLVDVIEGSRVYIPCIYVLNKIDQVWRAILASCDCYVCLYLRCIASRLCLLSKQLLRVLTRQICCPMLSCLGC